MKKILVLGCTGSIGTSTLNIVRSMPEDFSICGLTAHNNEKSLNFLSNEFSCDSVLTSKDGIEAIEALIQKTNPDIVVNGIAGAAGLLPSKITIECGKKLALANKETVVMAWPLIKELAFNKEAEIIPVDSEHSAIFSLINQVGRKNIKNVIITASGGPFRTFSRDELEKVTVEQALQHPTWNMGKKITIDSASLANKGLEVIEANRLFDFEAKDIQVVVHPQSLIHSMVRTNDGMLYAQISDPDMKHPIFNALTWPENKQSCMNEFDLFDQTMTFYRPRMIDFPMLSYAFEVAQRGKAYTIAYNAANEVAVSAFLEKKISFMAIPRIVRSTLDKDWNHMPSSFEDVFEIDKQARKYTEELI